MSRKWIIRISLFLLATIIITTIFFGLVQTKQFSAYGECRKAAMTTKGYAVWKYERTIQMVFMSWVVFSDGYNDLTCHAVGVGPFWAVQGTDQTLVGCVTGLGEGGGWCPEDYFGVSP